MDKAKVVKRNKANGSKLESEFKTFLKKIGWFVNKTGVSTKGIDLLAIKEDVALLIEVKRNFDPKKEKFNLKPYFEAYKELKEKTKLKPYILLFVKIPRDAVPYKIYYYDFEKENFDTLISSSNLDFISKELAPEKIEKTISSAQNFDKKYNLTGKEIF